MLKSKRKIPVIKNIFFVIGYSFKYCKMRVISIFIIALFQGINAANVAMFYKLALESLGREKPFLSLLAIIAVYLTIHLLSLAVSNVFTGVKYPVWDVRIRNGISKRLYEKYITIDLKDMQNAEFYDNYIRALNEADQRSIQVLNMVQYIASNLFSAAGILSVVVMLEPPLIIFAVVPVISSFFVNMRITKERYDYEVSLTGWNRKLDYIKRVFSLPQYREEIRTGDYKEMLFAKYSRANEGIISVIKGRMPSIIHKSAFGANLFSFINYSLPALYLGWSLLNERISIGDFSTLLVGTANLSSAIFYLVILIPQMAQHAMFINNLKGLLDYRSEMEPTTESRIVKDSEKRHSIRLEHVSFRYGSGHEDTLKDISMTIHRGEKIALVGENGAGKSTLVKLLLRLYDPQSGSLYMDDVNYKELDVDSLRRTVSVVYQDFQSFAFSIGENVLAREMRDKGDENRVWEALRESGLYTKVKNLPKELNTFLTNEFEEDGINLSGGESQKLAIARAACRNAGVLIMDEPASSLDPLSEQEMYRRMVEQGKDKTLVLISHRLYSTKMVDKIYYMEKGAIVESGSHEELMGLNGKYAYLYNLQAEQYR